MYMDPPQKSEYKSHSPTPLSSLLPCSCSMLACDLLQFKVMRCTFGYAGIINNCNHNSQDNNPQTHCSLLSFAAFSSFSASAFSTSSVWCWTLLPHQGSSHDMKTYDSSWSCSCCPNICGSNGKADVHHLPPSERKSVSATSLLNPTRLIDLAL